jgi:hypothetical protein
MVVETAAAQRERRGGGGRCGTKGGYRDESQSNKTVQHWRIPSLLSRRAILLACRKVDRHG